MADQKLVDLQDFLFLVKIFSCWKENFFRLKMTLIASTLSQPLLIKLICIYLAHHFLESGKKLN